MYVCINSTSYRPARQPSRSWRALGALGALQDRKGKGLEPPGTWGPSGGPQGAPGPFPSRTRLGASGGPRSSWGPAALGAREPPGGPRDSWAGAWAQGAGGPKERRGPCVLRGTASGPGAQPLGLNRPGNPPGAPGALGVQERGGSRAPRGASRGLWGTPGLPQESQGPPGGPQLRT